MCTVLLPPAVNPIAVNNVSHHKCTYLRRDVQCPIFLSLFAMQSQASAL